MGLKETRFETVDVDPGVLTPLSVCRIIIVKKKEISLNIYDSSTVHS